MISSPLFAWYGLWTGVYVDRKARWLYVMLLPTLGCDCTCGATRLDDSHPRSG